MIGTFLTGRCITITLLAIGLCGDGFAQSGLAGKVSDPQGKAVAGATVAVTGSDGVRVAEKATDIAGRYAVAGLKQGVYELTVSAWGFASVTRTESLAGGSGTAAVDVELAIRAQSRSVVVTATTTDPALDMRNGEVFERTLFTRDDQVFQQLNGGVDAGQHEGGGKSLEIRRFGFNLDHGGVNGGLKVLVDDVQQNQSTQGHGQGYLGSLKAVTPELIQDVTMINGPFSAEYGDYSGLGVVHIRQRESLQDEFTARIQAGNFATRRAFFGISPSSPKVDSYMAYEGTYSDGPFVNRARYKRDNINSNYTKSLDGTRKAGVRVLLGSNRFYSSGQLPLDLVESGVLDRFGYVDPTAGGNVRLGTVSGYLTKLFVNGDTLRVSASLERSLFDLYSNFTYFLNDPVNGDAIQQHDSRLQEGANVQYAHAHRIGRVAASFKAGGNLLDSQINVGLYPRDGRMPTGVTTRANARVTNGAGYAQEIVSFWDGKLILSGGLRFDQFRYDVRDRVNAEDSGLQSAGRWQGKGGAAYTPSHSVPLTLTLNYGRGVNSVDARGVVQRPDSPRLATTDFYQLGVSTKHGRFGVSGDLFLVDHSNEQVYIPDDGSVELKGPSRAYGYEAKAVVEVTRHLTLNGGMTKVANSFYRGGDHRVYVDSAPHFVANSSLTLTAWRGWSGSLRARATNHYRLDGEDPSILAAGHVVIDASVARRISRKVDLNFSMDNLTGRRYYETQNYFESRITPDGPAMYRVHGTPGFPMTAVAGITMRFGSR